MPIILTIDSKLNHINLTTRGELLYKIYARLDDPNANITQVQIDLRLTRYPVQGTVEHDNLAILQQMYARPEGFVNAQGETVELVFSGGSHITSIDELDDHGLFNPFVKGEFENYLARLLAQSGGSPSSGLAHEYESLLELSPGVRQVPNSKWFDGVHYDGVGGDTLRFQTPTDHIHIEGGHITYFIYNSSNDEALRVENHKGVEETVVDPQHSVDIRIVEEHEGAGSLIVYNEGTYHKDFDETDVSERRWQEAVHWAKREMRKAQAVSRFDRYEYTPQLVQTYSAYVYNTLFVAHNPLNRSTDTKWATIRQNMFTWDFFSRNADGKAVANRVRLDGALNIVHDLENLWVWERQGEQYPYTFLRCDR